ncbi:DNA polymerase gamma [Yarrowia sp. B02]|nr:DNA polymerase gamma [Yarrowia sp. B02]
MLRFRGIPRRWRSELRTVATQISRPSPSYRLLTQSAIPLRPGPRRQDADFGAAGWDVTFDPQGAPVFPDTFDHLKMDPNAWEDVEDVKKPEKQAKKVVKQGNVEIDSKGRRINPMGIQMLSSGIYNQLFGDYEMSSSFTKPEMAKLETMAKHHLTKHELLGKKTKKENIIDFDLPPMLGTSLDEHFYRMAKVMGEPYMDIVQEMMTKEFPARPNQKDIKTNISGWVRYAKGKKPEKVEYPREHGLVFDIEVLYKVSGYPVVASAVSTEAWYVWMSPWLVDKKKAGKEKAKAAEGENLIVNHPKESMHLIPMGPPDEPRVIVGHNIGYDRQAVKEEYSLQQTKNFFLDTLSLHVSVNGMCSRQRGTWMKARKDQKRMKKLMDDEDLGNQENVNELLDLSDDLADAYSEDPWVMVSATNSLAEVAHLHLNGLVMSKDDRELFSQETLEELRQHVKQAVDYNITDVDITAQVFKKILPLFLKTCPHPVSFTALKNVSSAILPTDSEWKDYLDRCETMYQDMKNSIDAGLQSLVNEAVKLKDEADKEPWLNDPWLSQIDWTIKPVKMVKIPAKQGGGERLPKNVKFPGYPEWYKSLFKSSTGPMHITTKTRLTPLLLRLKWEGYPVVWSDKEGWMFRVPVSEKDHFEAKKYKLATLDTEPHLREDGSTLCFRIPHKDGGNTRTTQLMGKSFLGHFEKGTLSSDNPQTKEMFEMSVSSSYWVSNRSRIMSQHCIWDGDGVDMGRGPDFGIIIPRIIPMGTITRRCVENTWLTASNAKKNRIGSELKAMIKAPPGYSFVGADVDSEELWIASLYGDSCFKNHGSTAIGWMTLEGTKSEGTDLHSKTASILGISRNEAKIFNYGRIYGAGLKFAEALLKQFAPGVTDAQAASLAGQLYTSTKGKKIYSIGKYSGGTESILFNKLEEIATQDMPETPILGAVITKALSSQNLRKSSFMTSRVNWTIQSSGVDYLHMLVVSMEYLAAKYDIDMRLCITVHDELRFLVKNEDAYRAAMALQVSNIWTRGMFCQQSGIDDIPQGCAFFSAVDIDHVLRKEVDFDCITPTHPDPIPHGESLDIEGLLAREDARLEDDAHVVDHSVDHKARQFPYSSRTPVLAALESNPSKVISSLLDQIGGDKRAVLKQMSKL